MSVFKVHPPFPVFIDNNSEHLDGGKIYIGEAGKNPIAFPVQVYLDNELTVPASQPLRTSKGMLIGPNGKPTSFYMGLNAYSIAVYSSADQYINGDLDVSVYQYDETATPRTYDREWYVPGVLRTSYPVIKGVTARDFRWMAGNADKYARCVKEPSAETVFDIRKNTVSIGSITFPDSSFIGVITFNTQVDFSEGDEYDIMSPSSVNSLEGLYVTFAGERG